MTYKITRLNNTTVDIQLAGITFRDKKELEQVHKALKCSKSHNVKFRYQKDNKADPNAIMVFINDIHVGYIPKDFCETFKKNHVQMENYQTYSLPKLWLQKRN